MRGVLTGRRGGDYALACNQETSVCNALTTIEHRSRGGRTMRSMTLAAILGSFLAATALTSVRAGDMTFDRALHVDKEPQNWLLHHGNYAGHRFSPLTTI